MDTEEKVTNHGFKQVEIIHSLKKLPSSKASFVLLSQIQKAKRNPSPIICDAD